MAQRILTLTPIHTHTHRSRFSAFIMYVVNGGRESLSLCVQKVKCKMNVVFIVISCVYYECQALRSHAACSLFLDLTVCIVQKELEHLSANTLPTCLLLLLLLLCTVYACEASIQEKMFGEQAKDKVPERRRRRRRAISRHLFGASCVLIVVAVIKSDNKSFSEVEMCPI